MKTINKFRMSIILIACCVGSFVCAQDTKAFLSANVGSSTPLYANMNSLDMGRGLYLDVDAAYFVTKSVGLGLSLAQHGHYISDQNTSSFFVGGYSETNKTFSDKFTQVNILFGPCFTFDYERASVDFKPMLGFAFNSVPAWVEKTDAHTNYGATFNTTYVIGGKSSGSAVSYGGSVALRMAVTDKFALRFFVNYVGSDGYKFINSGAGVVYTFKTDAL